MKDINPSEGFPSPQQPDKDTNVPPMPKIDTSDDTQGKPFQAGGGFDSFRTWMGDENYEQFKKELSQEIIRDMQKRIKISHEINKKAQDEIEGKD